MLDNTPLSPDPFLDPIDKAIYDWFPDYWGECYRLMSQRKYKRKWVRGYMDRDGVTTLEAAKEYLTVHYPKP